MSLKLGLAVGLVSVLVVACTPVATPSAPEVTELPRQEVVVAASATPVPPPSATALPSPRTATPTAAMIRALPEPTSTDVIVQREEDMQITVLYDNNAGDSQLETAWGFSCLVEGLEQTILFDTGGDGAMLLRNMERLQRTPQQVDVIVLSHAHADHTGGLTHFLDQNSDVTVYAPASFPRSIRDAVINAGGDFVAVDESRRVCNRARLTGELGTNIKEISLLIEGPEGLLVITGCAHPGIVEITRQSKQLTGLPVDFVMGGFHLGSTSAEKIGVIVAELKALGVRRVGPCHCSGDLARRLFEEAYGPGYVPINVGAQVAIGTVD